MGKSAGSGSKPVKRSAFDDACRSLARRRLTEEELRQRLLKRHSITEVGKALAKLKEYRFIDDESLTADHIKDRLKLSPRSTRMIEFELVRRGIKPEIFRQVLDAEFPDHDDLDAARQALQSKLKTISKHPPQGRRERALRFLSSQGFSYEVISEVWEWFCANTDALSNDHSDSSEEP